MMICSTRRSNSYLAIKWKSIHHRDKCFCLFFLFFYMIIFSLSFLFAQTFALCTWRCSFLAKSDSFLHFEMWSLISLSLIFILAKSEDGEERWNLFNKYEIMLTCTLFSLSCVYRNPVVSCDSLPDTDLRAWRENPGKFASVATFKCAYFHPSCDV